MNNIAELVGYKLDKPEIIQNEWKKLICEKHDFKFQARTYVNLDFFTHYFQNLINDISGKVGQYKNIVIQCHDKFLHDEKWHLNVIHKDAERLCCITVPIIYNQAETVNFYKTDGLDRGKSPNRKADQRLAYSLIHPNLVNVSNYHNVRVLEDISPRILLQLSYDVKFDEIINKNSSLWVVK